MKRRRGQSTLKTFKRWDKCRNDVMTSDYDNDSRGEIEDDQTEGKMVALC